MTSFVVIDLFILFIIKEERNWPIRRGKLIDGGKTKRIKKIETKELYFNNRLVEFKEIPLFSYASIINIVLVGLPTIKLIINKINSFLFSNEKNFLKKG